MGDARENAAVEARGLGQTYATGHVRVEAVRGVDLTARRGEMVLLMGPSGSGKTTLLSMVGCILRPTRRAGRILGREVRWSEEELPRLRRRSLGFIFQHFNLLGSLTAQENVEVVLQPQGLRGDPARRRARDALDAVGLETRAGFLPRDLSGGEKQRVAVARALASDPEILLADEPTGNLDSRTGHAITEILRRAATEGGKAVVVVTHDERLRDLADRILRMEDGRVRGEGT